MRAVVVLAWALLVAFLLRSWLRVGRPPARRPRGAPDELVKDPVCHAYIVRSRALSRMDNGVLHHFCSPECARQFAPGGSRSRG